MIFHIEQRDARWKLRGPVQRAAESAVVHYTIAPVAAPRIELPEPSLYRISIPGRGADHEPLFVVVPKYPSPVISRGEQAAPELL